MSAAISALLAIIAQIAPGATTTLITTIINALLTIIPLLVKEYQDVLPMVQNIIAALKDSGEVTDEQMAQLQAMEVQIDAAFEAAAAAAQAQDGASS